MLQLNRRAVTIAALWQTSKEHSDKNIRVVRVNDIKKKEALIYDTLPEKKGLAEDGETVCPKVLVD